MHEKMRRWHTAIVSCWPASWAGRHAFALADAAQLLVQAAWSGRNYVPLAVRPEGLAAALRALHPLGFAGCNLTIPTSRKR